MLYVAAVMFAFFKVSNLSAPSLSRITPTLPAAGKADSALSGIATRKPPLSHTPSPLPPTNNRFLAEESHWSEQFSNFDEAEGLSQAVLMKMTKELLLLRSKAVLEMTKELEETPEDELEKAFEEANALVARLNADTAKVAEEVEPCERPQNLLPRVWLSHLERNERLREAVDFVALLPLSDDRDDFAAELVVRLPGAGMNKAAIGLLGSCNESTQKSVKVMRVTKQICGDRIQELVDEKKWMQASGFLADTARLGVNDQTRGEWARKLFDIMTGSEKWAEAQFLVLAVAERAAELYIVGMSKELVKHHRAKGNRGGVLDLVKGLTAYVRARNTPGRSGSSSCDPLMRFLLTRLHARRYPKLQEELMKGFTSVRVAGGGVDEAELREAIKTGSWDDVHRLAAEASAEMLDKILPGREKGDSVFAKVMGRGDAAGMTEALIPSWVRRIPPFAFAGCAGLQHVRFEAGGGGRVEEIGEGAFARCKGLERFELPRLVKRIEKRTFYGCEDLKEVKGLGGVDLVAERAFENCYALEGAELGGGGEGARDVEIGVEGFVCCSIMEKLVLGSRVKKVGHRAFAGCECLASVVIEGGAGVVGGGAGWNWTLRRSTSARPWRSWTRKRAGKRARATGTRTS
jgi:hypothetical protein